VKILRVVGARPQFMQVPILRKALIDCGHSHFLLHTGQHYDEKMSNIFFHELGIPAPDINLGISGLSHGAMTGQMMEGIESSILLESPDLVLVDGDTNSTMAAALSAVKLHIPVVHVEAGLRDFDKRRPEEINRIVADHISTLNCAPIPRALTNLVNEGLGATSKLFGDILLDCFLSNLKNRSYKVVKDLNLRSGSYYLSTLHRPENTDLDNFDRFKDIISFLSDLDKVVVLPIHPRTKGIFDRYIAAGGNTGKILPVEPVSYFEMLGLLEGADCVFTDSGGLPREAVWSGCKCVMLFRKETWHDLLENGWATIGMTDRNSIESAFQGAEYPDSAKVRDFFGGGQASQRLAGCLKNFQ
jgi:UDP-N-acetylglucosamine 2-epimerase